MISLRSIASALAGAALLVGSSIAHSTKRNPVSYVSLVDEPVIGTPSNRVNANSRFDLTFTLHEGLTPIRLALEPNYDILHEDLAITYLDTTGEVREYEPVARAAHRVYKGRAFVPSTEYVGWTEAGWARITVHRDGKKPIFEGAFRVFGDSHHVQTGHHYRKLKHSDDPAVNADDYDGEVMVVYRDSDIIPSRALYSDLELKRRSVDGTVESVSCDSDSLPFNSRYDSEMHILGKRRSESDTSLRFSSMRSLFGRQSIDTGGGLDGGANYIPDIGSTAGCPSTRRVALVGIATDCNYWDAFDGNREELRSNVIDIVNRASALYEDTFRISLGIRNLTVIDRGCGEGASDSTPWNLACDSNTDLGDRLNLFSSWRGDHQDSNAYWSLLTTCNTGSAVGLAWRGQLCRQGASRGQDSDGGNETVAAANVVVRTTAEWQIFAHETGHTFGAVHDCTEEACPVSTESQTCCPLSSTACNAGGQYIMNPSTGDGISEFSPCSIGNICSGLQANVDAECLTDNRNVGTITGSQCGNGIVEEGEECDCGGSDCGDNNCCNPDTCEFREGAQCDPTNEDCCTDSCRFASEGTVCRASTGDCDPEETCPGGSGSCPHNEQRADGDSCGDGLHCASGQCTSRDMQCRSMLGSGNGSGNGDSRINSCGDNSLCAMACSNPASGSSQCTLYSRNYLDGTSCGSGGQCENGICQGSSSLNAFAQWFRDHPDIAIPVGASIGGLIVIAILWCIFRRCRRRSRARRRAKNTPNMSGASIGPDYPPPTSNYNNNPYGMAPPPFDHPIQPPQYTYAPDGRRFQRTASMRYA